MSTCACTSNHYLLCGGGHTSAVKEVEWQAREERARQHYEKHLEERKRRLEEQRVKEDKRRAAVDEKRRQKLEEDRVLTHVMYTPVHPRLIETHTHTHNRV